MYIYSMQPKSTYKSRWTGKGKYSFSSTVHKHIYPSGFGDYES